MATKTEMLDALFQKWEQEVPEYQGRFIKDGIINEPLFEKATAKVLFIEKEPNDQGQISWDFWEWWKGEIKYAFTARIAEWSYGILSGFPEYDVIWSKDNNALNAINQIAFMNVKKSGGKGNSEYNTVIGHARLNYDNLHKQIEIIAPDIIITGFSWNELRDTVFPNIIWQKSGYDIDIARFNGAKVIDFYHPSARNAPAAAYSLLQNVIRSSSFSRL